MALPNTAAFFDELARRKHEPLLRRETGTLRWDVHSPTGIECWYIEVTDGDIAVSKKNADADAVVRSDEQLLEALVTGNENAMASLLRGVIDAEGNLTLVLSFQRLLPGPSESKRDELNAKVNA